MAVILNIVGFDAMAKINCQVSFVPYVLLFLLSNIFSKVWITFCAVGASVYVPTAAYAATPNISFCFFI